MRMRTIALALGVTESNCSSNLPAHLLLWPVASALYLCNALVAVSRRIKWRGITYELKSATEAVIISRAAQYNAKQSRPTGSTDPFDETRKASRHSDPVCDLALQLVLQDVLLSRRTEPAGRHDVRANRKRSRARCRRSQTSGFLVASRRCVMMLRKSSTCLCENNGVQRLIIPTNGLVKNARL